MVTSQVAFNKIHYDVTPCVRLNWRQSLVILMPVDTNEGVGTVELAQANPEQVMIISICVGGLVGWFISAAFLLMGAAVAGVEGRTYGRALGATFAGGILSSIVSFGVVYFLGLSEFGRSSDPILIVVLGSLAGSLVYVLMIQTIFGTSFGKALGTFIMTAIFAVMFYGLIFAILMATMSGQLQSLIDQLRSLN